MTVAQNWMSLKLDTILQTRAPELHYTPDLYTTLQMRPPKLEGSIVPHMNSPKLIGHHAPEGDLEHWTQFCR